MDAVVKPLAARLAEAAERPAKRPSREDAEAAVRTLIRWAGDDPRREGLADTPSRVAKAFEQLFKGYRENPAEILDRVFEEVEGYGDIVLVRDIPFYSHCEHHMVPFLGKAHIAYYPSGGRRRPVEARPSRRRLRPPPADPGDHDRADRRGDRRGPAAARRRNHARRRAFLHVDARRAEGRRPTLTTRFTGRLQGRPGRAGPFPDADRRAARLDGAARPCLMERPAARAGRFRFG